MQDNPYHPPSADLSSSSAAVQDGLTPRALRELSGTRPWVRVLGFLGLVGVALLLVSASLAAVAGIDFVFFYLLASYYLLLAVIFGLPCLTLCRYGNAIARLSISSDKKALVQALSLQRRFWKAFGIGCIVTIVMTASGSILVPLVFVPARPEPASEATFDSEFPEDMDLSEIEDL